MSISIDPTTLAVLRGAFVSVAHDMSRLLCRTSQSYITAVLRDHHTGVYDASGRLIASSLTLPALAGTGRFQAKLVVEKFKGINPQLPADDIAETALGIERHSVRQLLALLVRKRAKQRQIA